MATAQEAFDAMVRDLLRPGLREIGFRGSGTTFVWPSDTHHALIGLQKSRTATSKVVAFTANVSVGGRVAWDEARTAHEWLPAQPAPNSRYGGWIWQRRIGLLMPDGLDHWWEVKANRNWRPVGREVLDAILTHALPAIRARLSDRDM